MPNDVTQQDLKQATENLANILQLMRAKLDSENAERLDEVQKAWLAFQEKDIALQSMIGMVQSPESRLCSQKVAAEARTVRVKQLVTALESVLGNKSMPGAVTSIEKGNVAVPDQLKRLPDPKIAPLPVPPDVTRESIRPQIIDRLNFGSLVLDMEENLLVGSSAEFVDFWDVQTGGLIRRVPNTGIDGHYDFEGALPLHNLGKGRVVALGGFRGGDILVWLHRDAAEAQRIEEVSTKRGNRVSTMTTGDMIARKSGDIAYFGTQNVQLLVGKIDSGLRQFERTEDNDYCWGLSQDGSRLLVASTDLSDDDARTTLSCFDARTGAHLSKQLMATSEKFVSAICGAGPVDEFFVTTGAGNLIRYHAERGVVDREADPVYSLIHVPGHQYHWLSGTQADWCLFGGHPAKKSKTGQHLPGTESVVRASRGAPDGVHEMVAKWTDIRVFTVDREGAYAAVSTRAGHVEIFHAETGRVVQTLGKFDSSSPITFLSSNHRGVQLATIDQYGSEVPELRVVDTTLFRESKIPLREFRVERDQPLSLSVGIGASNSLLAFQHAREKEKYRQNMIPLLADDSEQNTPSLPDHLNLGPPVDGVILGNHLYKEAPVAVAVDAYTHEQLAEFSLSSFSEQAKLEAYHRETGKGLVFSYSDSIVTLCEPGGTFKESDSWKLQANVFRFSNRGDRAICALRGSYTQGTIALLDLTSPGKILWQLEESPLFAQFTRDDRYVLFVSQLRAKWGSEGYNILMLYDVESGKMVSDFRYNGQFYGVNAETTRAYIRLAEGGYQILQIQEGKMKKVARYLPAENGAFTFLLPNGYYLTQGDALARISFSEKGRSQPAESYDIKFNRPDLVARAMGSPPELIAAFERAYKKRLRRLGMSEQDLDADLVPPDVEIDFEEIPMITESRNIRIPLAIQKGSSGLSALEVTINDVPLYGRSGKTLNGSSAPELEVELSPGANKVTVWVRDDKGLTSSRETVNVVCQAKASSKPDLYVLSIGIDDYVGESHDLELAGKDATDIVTAFSQHGRNGFSDVKTLVLRDELATRSGILEKAAPFLKDAGVDDQVVVFMAGHGVLDADYEYRFCCSDLDVDRIGDTTLTYDEIEGFFDQCSARKRVVLLDTCHAGEADADDERLAEVGTVPAENVRSVSFQPFTSVNREQQEVRVSDLMKGHFVDLRIGVGAAVLASSSAHQAALEMNEVRNGIFTASVLQGIRDRKADLDGDDAIQISELLEYCRVEVQRLSGAQQEPVARHVNRSEDFEVVSFR
ncbi:MAG: caspase family protein [Verrucomicrobiales bacterium]|nr:caspase family protein [Verrucomicrobiales bacterium]